MRKGETFSSLSTIQAYLLLLCLLYSTSQVLHFFTNWRQDPPPEKGLWLTLFKSGTEPAISPRSARIKQNPGEIQAACPSPTLQQFSCEGYHIAKISTWFLSFYPWIFSSFKIPKSSLGQHSIVTNGTLCGVDGERDHSSLLVLITISCQSDSTYSPAN